jgi:hypothetical protein
VADLLVDDVVGEHERTLQTVSFQNFVSPAIVATPVAMLTAGRRARIFECVRL